MAKSNDLVDVLEDVGVEVHKITGDEIQCRCPVHYKVKGRESHRYTFYLNIDTGLWHCFTCGARGNLYQLISEMTSDLGQLWKIQSHLISQGLRRLDPEEAKYDQDVRENLDWMTYAKFSPLPDTILKHRKLDPEIALRYGIRWDTKEKCTLTPIVSPLGELRGYQQKKEGWVNNYPSGVHKKDTLFGIERAYAPTAILLESPMDVARFHSVYEGMDYSAVAAFGANVSNEQLSLLYHRFDGLVLALDNDEVGFKETNRLVRLMPSFRSGHKFWNYAPDDPKDLGEMTDHQIIKGLGRISRVQRRTMAVPGRSSGKNGGPRADAPGHGDGSGQDSYDARRSRALARGW